MDSFIIMLLWFLFTLIMLDIIHKKLFNINKNVVKKQEDLQEIKNIKYKTVDEQLKFIDTSNKLYINFPLLLIIITIGIVIFSLIMGIIPDFINGMVVASAWSFAYALLIIMIKRTDNDDYYFMIVFMYILFMAISMLINRYHSTTTNFWIMLGSYIGIYLIWMKVKKWFL